MRKSITVPASVRTYSWMRSSSVMEGCNDDIVQHLSGNKDIGTNYNGSAYERPEKKFRRFCWCLIAEPWATKSRQMKRPAWQIRTKLKLAEGGSGSPPTSLLADLQARPEDLDARRSRKVFEKRSRPNRSRGPAVLSNTLGEKGHTSSIMSGDISRKASSASFKHFSTCNPLVGYLPVSGTFAIRKSFTHPVSVIHSWVPVDVSCLEKGRAVTEWKKED